MPRVWGRDGARADRWRLNHLSLLRVHDRNHETYPAQPGASAEAMVMRRFRGQLA
jgi:hypothetical protein